MRSRGGSGNMASSAGSAPYRYRPPPQQQENFGYRENMQAAAGGDDGGGDGGGDVFVSTVGYERPPSATEKVANSLQGLLWGPVFIFFGCMLLWYNEEWAVKTYRSLNEALDAYVPIHDMGAVAEKPTFYQNKLVHLTEMLKVNPDEVLTDPRFGLSRPNVISLHRNVEIYQWVETIKQERQKKPNGEVEVREIITYNKKWVSNPISSDGFRHVKGHENTGPTNLPVSSDSFAVSQVNLADFIVGNTLRSQIKGTSEVPNLRENIKALPADAELHGNVVFFPRGGAQNQQQQQLAAAPSAELSLPVDAIEERVMKIDGEDKIMYTVKATGDAYFEKEKAVQAARSAVVVGAQQQQQQRQMRNIASQPEIGDVRVTFSELRCKLVSVLAMLSGRTLTGWPSRQGQGYEVAILAEGAVTAADMISSAHTANSVRTWLLRGSGWLLNFIGFSCITSIISTTADITLNWIPLLGPMANSIINLGLTAANLILANCITLLVASIAWVVYRPVLGISMLVGSIGLFVASSRIGRDLGASLRGKSFKSG